MSYQLIHRGNIIIIKKKNKVLFSILKFIIVSFLALFLFLSNKMILTLLILILFLITLFMNFFFQKRIVIKNEEKKLIIEVMLLRLIVIWSKCFDIREINFYLEKYSIGSGVVWSITEQKGESLFSQTRFFKFRSEYRAVEFINKLHKETLIKVKTSIILFLLVSNVFAQQDSITNYDTLQVKQIKTFKRPTDNIRIVITEYNNEQKLILREEFYENLTLKKKVHFLENKFEGSYEEFWESGERKQLSYWSKGKPTGWAYFYYKNGVVKEKHENNREALDGHVLGYYENGKIEISGCMNRGKRSGVWLYYDVNGNEEKKECYKRGELIGK